MDCGHLQGQHPLNLMPGPYSLAFAKPFDGQCQTWETCIREAGIIIKMQQVSNCCRIACHGPDTQKFLRSLLTLGVREATISSCKNLRSILLRNLILMAGDGLPVRATGYLRCLHTPRPLFSREGYYHAKPQHHIHVA